MFEPGHRTVRIHTLIGCHIVLVFRHDPGIVLSFDVFLLFALIANVVPVFVVEYIPDQQIALKGCFADPAGCARTALVALYDP